MKKMKEVDWMNYDQRKGKLLSSSKSKKIIEHAHKKGKSIESGAKNNSYKHDALKKKMK